MSSGIHHTYLSMCNILKRTKEEMMQFISALLLLRIARATSYRRASSTINILLIVRINELMSCN